ncbi:MAG TPA: MFS transporter [Bryobacteraceae bacterium]|jgi:ACS family hexuronate transporter-like MFS transporter|nr:MFS transporter [Bryobacteraceae bacterium]
MSLTRGASVSTDVVSRHLAMDWRVWTASVAMMFCSWLSYVDRQILAVLSPMILRDTHLTAQSYAEVVSAFSIAYMIANPLWGSILDFVGMRIGMLAAVAIWTVASASHAWMAGFWGFAAVRALLGLGEGATFPGGLRASMDSLPPERHSRGIAISYSGGSLGAIVAPLVVVPIALRFGWRAAFLFSGALGVAWLVMWSFIARPPYLPRPERKPQRMEWPNPFERRFWALVTSYALGAIAIGPILYLSPLYLNRVVGFSEADLGKVLWIPPLGWELGYFFWGWAADRFAPDQARPIRMFLLLAVAAIPVAAVPWSGSPTIVLLLFFWSMFITGGFQMLALRTGARAYPREKTALAGGTASGAWSAVAAMLLPLTGRWFDQQRYIAIFGLIAIMPLVGTTLWLWLSRPAPSRTLGV